MSADPGDYPGENRPHFITAGSAGIKESPIFYCIDASGFVVICRHWACKQLDCNEAKSLAHSANDAVYLRETWQKIEIKNFLSAEIVRLRREIFGGRRDK